MNNKLDVIFVIVLCALLLGVVVFLTIYTDKVKPQFENKPTVLILDKRVDLTLYSTPIYIVEYMDTATLEYRYADFRSSEKLDIFLEYLDKIAILEWLVVAE